MAVRDEAVNKNNEVAREKFDNIFIGSEVVFWRVFPFLDFKKKKIDTENYIQCH